MDWNARVIVIVDGELPSATACAAAAEAVAAFGAPEDAARPERQPIAFIPAGLDPRRRAGAEHQAGNCRMRVVSGKYAAESLSGTHESFVLLEAIEVARAEGCRQVLWPVQLGGEPVDHVAAKVDKSLLLSRISACDLPDHAEAGVRIETPYADLTDVQMALLARDLGVSVRQCWWWGISGDGDAARLLERWTRAFGELGVRVESDKGAGRTTF